MDGRWPRVRGFLGSAWAAGRQAGGEVFRGGGAGVARGGRRAAGGRERQGRRPVWWAGNQRAGRAGALGPPARGLAAAALGRARATPPCSHRVLGVAGEGAGHGCMPLGLRFIGVCGRRPAGRCLGSHGTPTGARRRARRGEGRIPASGDCCEGKERDKIASSHAGRNARGREEGAKRGAWCGGGLPPPRRREQWQGRGGGWSVLAACVAATPAGCGAAWRIECHREVGPGLGVPPATAGQGLPRLFVRPPARRTLWERPAPSEPERRRLAGGRRARLRGDRGRRGVVRGEAVQQLGRLSERAVGV
jgi:hypothetical protein